ncbi:MAG: glycoside hydrolase family 3 protein [Bacteroidetes bacterium]|jgi:beta-glucosidase|nr:glycoside hydrolase family 3 protein [Bacteroidota bacterium]
MKTLIVFSLTVFSLVSFAQTETWKDHTKDIDSRVQDLLSRMTVEEKCTQMLNHSDAIPRLGIEQYNWWNEALHGVARSGKATVFPQAIGLGATFDEDLMFRIGTAVSDEARAINNDLRESGKPYIQYMGLTFWSPNVNLFRDARWGRGQETFGEDPYLTGLMGSAFIKGMQGDHPKYLKTGTCAKHYVVHSGPEGERHVFNAVADKQDMYESYLPAFKACVDAGVESIMCAYNRTNDEPCCGSEYLLQDILRDEWGFKGHILSDCWALLDFHTGHMVTDNMVESAAMALKAGVNLNCGDTYDSLFVAYQRGMVTEKEIDENLAILLRTRFRLGLFDPPSENPYTQIPLSVIRSPEHQDLAYEAALKSIVLLQNKNNVLPLRKDLGFIYMCGPLAGDQMALVGNYNGLSPDMTNFVEGIVEQTSHSTRVQYRPGTLLANTPRNEIDWYSELAREADATLVFLGYTQRLEGEEGEAMASPTKGDNFEMKLPENQLVMLRKLAEGHDKPIITVISAGSPVDLREIRELSDAIIYAWYPGEKGGKAFADIVFGNESPSGRLPISFPIDVNQLPDFSNYDMQGRTYRYADDNIMYPFGYGLGYSDFAYNELMIPDKQVQKGDSVEISFSITNIGDYDTDEVVQVYLRKTDAPQWAPNMELIRSFRLSLQQGQSRSQTFFVQPEQMELYNVKGEKVLLTGEYEVIVANRAPVKGTDHDKTSKYLITSFMVE